MMRKPTYKHAAANTTAATTSKKYTIKKNIMEKITFRTCCLKAGEAAVIDSLSPFGASGYCIACIWK